MVRTIQPPGLKAVQIECFDALIHESLHLALFASTSR